MKLSNLILSFGFPLLTVSTLSYAYPVIDQIVPSGGLSVKVYPDHQNASLYWYIPQSIEPWKRDSRYRSSLYQSDQILSFIFRGQASVDAATLQGVAKSIGVSVDRLTPISYDYSKDLICQNFYAGDTAVQWLFPSMIGNYLEVVPVSLRITNPDLIKEISYHLTSGGGFACTVSVGFKAVSTAFKVTLRADLNRVFERFEAQAHAEWLWWESDIRSFTESLTREGLIEIKAIEDASLPKSELDKQIQASMDVVTKRITEALFVQGLKLPTDAMSERGKPFSLRADYRRSAESSHFEATLTADKIQVKDTQIGLRMALE